MAGISVAIPYPPTGLELYDRGKPLWTKQRLVSAREQIQNNVPQFIVECINGAPLIQKNLGFNNPQNWRTKVIFFGYRHLRDPRVESSDTIMRYAFYRIQQIFVGNPAEGPYLFPRYNGRELDAALEQDINRWNASWGCTYLIRTLSYLDMGTINKIVCFGLGNYIGDGSAWFTKHPAALTIRDVLQQKYGLEVALMSHYTDYTKEMTNALSRRGFGVIGRHGVEGFLEVDKTTLVFSISPEMPVKQILAETSRPAVIITRSFKEADLDWKCALDTEVLSNRLTGMSDRCDPDTPRTKIMFDDYTGHPIWTEGVNHHEPPEIRAPWLTPDMMVYVRNEGVEYHAAEGA